MPSGSIFALEFAEFALYRQLRHCRIVDYLLFTAVNIGAVSIFGCTRHMLRTEGIQALFKGLSPSLVGSVPTR